MSQVVIKAENISKQYRLGLVGTGTVRDDFKRWWYHLRGKEDPFLKIGEANDRSQKGESDYVWSLKDINFEINQGDSVGIIGRNGAGKSTLLKILSQVTLPTTGKIYTKGRIASLLEVGTGFHPEMTGRENIYLNGAILGMRKHEITRKFDEIVAFSGVERYIDTPVKRYSSGMYVRLAFAVAAHLESEILIVDEVLAVGDAEFQKKCLGKMNDVSKGEGRTVLFVSHNMAAVRSLCSKGILLENGNITSNGNVELVLDNYQKNNFADFTDVFSGSNVIRKAILKTKNNAIKYNTNFKLDVYFESSIAIRNLVLGVVIKDVNDVALVGVNNKNYQKEKLHVENIFKGKVSIEIEKIKLFPGTYKIDLFLGDSITDIESHQDALIFTITESHDSHILNTLNFSLNKVFHESIHWSFKN